LAHIFENMAYKELEVGGSILALVVVD
jgi:hypothetical protein